MNQRTKFFKQHKAKHIGCTTQELLNLSKFFKIFYWRKQQLLEIIYHTCVEKRGKLIIPSFAVSRTQEIVYLLNNFYNDGKLPEKIPVYVDSPLAISATEVFKKNTTLTREKRTEVCPVYYMLDHLVPSNFQK